VELYNHVFEHKNKHFHLLLKQVRFLFAELNRHDPGNMTENSATGPTRQPLSSFSLSTVSLSGENGYSVLLAVCSAIFPASFGHVLPICMGQNILVNESIFCAIHFVNKWVNFWSYKKIFHMLVLS
jgi:hypothetical protein